MLLQDWDPDRALAEMSCFAGGNLRFDGKSEERKLGYWTCSLTVPLLRNRVALCVKRARGNSI